MTGDEEKPVGELYFDDSLYGEDMIELRETLDAIGFELRLDPIRDQGTLFKVDE